MLRLRQWTLLAALASAAVCACRPETDVPPGEDIRDLPTASEPLGGSTRDPAADAPAGGAAPAREQSDPAEPAEPATPLRPAPGGRED